MRNWIERKRLRKLSQIDCNRVVADGGKISGKKEFYCSIIKNVELNEKPNENR